MNARFNFDSIADFSERLEKEGELVRIREKVSPILEITEIANRVSKSENGGKALLFENVEGSSMPILINAFGSVKRMAMALGTDDVEEIARDVEKFIQMKTPETITEKLGMLPTLFRMTKFPPKVTSDSSPPCQQVVNIEGDIDLGRLPVLKCWPDDGGLFITLPCVITKSLDGKRNMGVYRMQVFNRRSTGMHWHIHKDGAAFYHEYAKAGKRMEVAVAIGCDPATVFSATAPLPYGIDELLLAGFIRGKPVELVKCITVDLEVPKHAEIVLEGYVDPDETRIEGPFGDHTGYYSLTGEYPVFHVTAITSKKNPIYLTTIVGKPPMEDCHMGKATERIFLPMLKTVNPEIADYDLPWEGVFHNCVIISVKKRYPAQSNKLMSSLWGAGQMAFAKMILAVDESVDVHDYKKVARQLLERIDIENGLVVTEGILDALDHSSPKPLHGAKLGIDATAPLPEEDRAPLESWAGRDATQFEKRCGEIDQVVAHAIPFKDVANPLAIISVDKINPGDGPRVAKEAIEGDSANAIRIVLVIDKDIDPLDYSTALWKFFNNVDPRRDITFDGKRLIVDATNKMRAEGHPREWPDAMVMDDEIIKQVDEKWERLGITI
ncbi:UbiD family decarboxylase associated with menaquinone via futalosine [hydrothermal vent metagenome]|uniref:UbiD family decarboxylase associated with menaquinone via futalosine n=1 Tax=hydrothermal vent metagenome TaxID=652676 RepID=A0A3B1CC75_9ZZZZ